MMIGVIISYGNLTVLKIFRERPHPREVKAEGNSSVLIYLSAYSAYPHTVLYWQNWAKINICTLTCWFEDIKSFTGSLFFHMAINWEAIWKKIGERIQCLFWQSTGTVCIWSSGNLDMKRNGCPGGKCQQETHTMRIHMRNYGKGCWRTHSCSARQLSKSLHMLPYEYTDTSGSLFTPHSEVPFASLSSGISWLRLSKRDRNSPLYFIV